MFLFLAWFCHFLASLLLEGWPGLWHRSKIFWLDVFFLLGCPKYWPLFGLGLFSPFFLSQLGRRLFGWAGLDRSDFMYGETPFFTWEKIIRKAGITKSDIVYDLGCGSGRLVWQLGLADYQAVGIEINPYLARAAARFGRLLKIEDCQIIEGDILKIDLRRGTVFYLPATAFSQGQLNAINMKLSDLPKGAKIICLTHPLANPRFKLTDKSTLPFSWAEEEVYFYEII